MVINKDKMSGTFALYSAVKIGDTLAVVKEKFKVLKITNTTSKVTVTGNAGASFADCEKAEFTERYAPTKNYTFEGTNITILGRLAGYKEPTIVMKNVREPIVKYEASYAIVDNI